MQTPPQMDEQHVSEAEKEFEGEDPEDDGMNQNDTEDDGSKYLYFFLPYLTRQKGLEGKMEMMK